MWFIGVEVEQETSASPPKKILDPSLEQQLNHSDCESGQQFFPKGYASCKMYRQDNALFILRQTCI